MRETQRQRLDALFRSRENQKIPLYEICGIGIAAYSRRIEELREEYDREDFLIVNYTKREDGVCKSWYAREPRSGRPRWQPRHKKPEPRTAAPDTPWERQGKPRRSMHTFSLPLPPVKSWFEVCAERDRKIAEPEFSLTP